MCGMYTYVYTNFHILPISYIYVYKHLYSKTPIDQYGSEAAKCQAESSEENLARKSQDAKVKDVKHQAECSDSMHVSKAHSTYSYMHMFSSSIYN